MFLVVLFYSFLVISCSLHTKSHGYLDYDSFICWIMWPNSPQCVQRLNIILYEKEHCTILYIINKIIMNNENYMIHCVWFDLVKHVVEIS